MSERENRETFTYNYSSSQQAEVKKIREKYIPMEENKMEQLRRLDESATRPGTVAALIEGILSTLVLGIGMCCCLVWAEKLFVPGIIIGVIGILGIAGAYPIYYHITKRRREKLAPEIIRLTDELLK